MAELKKLVEMEIEAKKEKKSKFKIKDEILVEGYWADIDGRKFSVSPAERGVVFDSTSGEKKYGIKKSGSTIVDGVETGKDYFEDLTFEQQYQLARAKVILLTKVQNKELYDWHQTSQRFKQPESEY